MPDTYEFRGRAFAEDCAKLWPFPKWIVRRIDSIQFLDRSRFLQKSTFDIHAPSASIISADKLLPDSGSETSQDSYIFPLFFRRKGIITDINTSSHHGKPFHICNKAVNVQFQAHLLVGLLCRGAAPNILTDTQLERYHDAAVEFLLDNTTNDDLLTLLTSFMSSDETIKESLFLLRRLQHQHIQCVELPLAKTDGTIVVKVESIDAQWRPQAMRWSKHVNTAIELNELGQHTDFSQRKSTENNKAPQSLPWIESYPESSIDDSDATISRDLPTASVAEKALESILRTHNVQTSGFPADEAMFTFEQQAEEFRPDWKVQLGLKSPEIKIPLDLDPLHFNTVHLRILAPEGMNVQSAAIFGSYEREESPNTPSLIDLRQDVRLPKGAYDYMCHHERAVFRVRSETLKSNQPNPNSFKVWAPFHINIRFDPNRSGFLYPLLATVSLTTLISFFALLAATLAPSPQSVQAPFLPQGTPLPPWNASFSAFLVAPLSIALVFFGRRDDGDFIRRIYNFYRIGFFILVAFSSASAASMALLRLGPTWKGITQITLATNLIISLIFLTFLGFHQVRILFTLLLRRYGVIDTYSLSYKEAEDSLARAYFFSAATVLLLTVFVCLTFIFNQITLVPWYVYLGITITIIYLVLPWVGIKRFWQYLL